MHADFSEAISLDGAAGKSVDRRPAMSADDAEFELAYPQGFCDLTVNEPAPDPCLDPQPGDVLAVGDDVREVLDRVGDRVEYGFPNRAASRWLTLIRWQVWARNAEVRKVAP